MRRPYPYRRRVLTALAVCHVANDYHSGQWSRGYRLLCACLRFLARHGCENPIDMTLPAAQQTLYRRLASRYGDTL